MSTRRGVRSVRNPQRDAAICAAYPEQTLEEIGAAHGISRQRVYQILVRNGVDTGPRTVRSRARALKGFTAYIEAMAGPTLAEAASRLGVSVAVLEARLEADNKLATVRIHLATRREDERLALAAARAADFTESRTEALTPNDDPR